MQPSLGTNETNSLTKMLPSIPIKISDIVTLSGLKFKNTVFLRNFDHRSLVYSIDPWVLCGFDGWHPFIYGQESILLLRW